MKVIDLIRLVKDNCNVNVVEESEFYDCPMPNNIEYNCDDCTFWDDEMYHCRYGDGRIPRISYFSLFTGKGDDVPIKIADRSIKNVWVEDVESRGRANKKIHTVYLNITVND